MESEQLKIFNEKYEPIGVATREEVHSKGYWHETFHCWVIGMEEGKAYIHLQIRSEDKKDYPGLLDITAAGHILAHETVEDGVREVHEEIGLDISINELIHCGVISYHVEIEGFIDKELANIFLYENKKSLHTYQVQKEEVSGITKIDFHDFARLWEGEKDSIHIQGFQIDENGEKVYFEKNVKQTDFVLHELSYYKRIIDVIEKYLETK